MGLLFSTKGPKRPNCRHDRSLYPNGRSLIQYLLYKEMSAYFLAIGSPRSIGDKSTYGWRE